MPAATSDVLDRSVADALYRPESGVRAGLEKEHRRELLVLLGKRRVEVLPIDRRREDAAEDQHLITVVLQVVELAFKVRRAFIDERRVRYPGRNRRKTP
jgi:hypothetical protein